MLDANLIIVSGIVLVSIKWICNSMEVVSKNRKEEAKYKYLEIKMKKELQENSEN